MAGQRAEAKALADDIAKGYPGATATLGGREWKLPEFLAWAGGLSPWPSEAVAMARAGEWLGTGSGQSLGGMSDCNVVPSPQWQATEASAAGEGLALMAMRPWLQRPTGGGYTMRAGRKGGHVVVRFLVKDGRGGVYVYGHGDGDWDGPGPASVPDQPLV
ncbi:MAG: hypothetical protein WCK05_14925, partial [Planctomycetota bacterium]